MTSNRGWGEFEESIVGETEILVSDKSYDILKRICKKYDLEYYVWAVINLVSIYPGGGSVDLLDSPLVFRLHKKDLVDPDWGEIENSIFTHSLLMTFL